MASPPRRRAPAARARRGGAAALPDRAGLERAKQASTLQLLFRAARLLDERAVARVAAGQPDGPRLRTAHTALLPHLDFEGVRLTELARRLGVSKQAVGPLIDDLEAMGVVDRVADPDDRRAKQVRFSRQGHAAMLHGLGVLRDVEAELAGVIGAGRMRALHETLVAILAVVDAGPAGEAR